MKLSNEYLYGTEDIPEIPAHIIMLRIQILEDHLHELYEVHYMDRDVKRIRAVEKAIKFWESAREV